MGTRTKVVARPEGHQPPTKPGCGESGQVTENSVPGKASSSGATSVSFQRSRAVGFEVNVGSLRKKRRKIKPDDRNSSMTVFEGEPGIVGRCSTAFRVNRHEPGQGRSVLVDNAQTVVRGWGNLPRTRSPRPPKKTKRPRSWGDLPYVGFSQFVPQKKNARQTDKGRNAIFITPAIISGIVGRERAGDSSRGDRTCKMSPSIRNETAAIHGAVRRLWSEENHNVFLIGSDGSRPKRLPSSFWPFTVDELGLVGRLFDNGSRGFFFFEEKAGLPTLRGLRLWEGEVWSGFAKHGKNSRRCGRG